MHGHYILDRAKIHEGQDGPDETHRRILLLPSIPVTQT